MQTLDFKVGFGRKKLADGEEQRTMRHHTWVAVAIGGSAVIGAGVGLYGANKQAKAVDNATATNAQLQTQQNNSAWQSYLMSRGVNPMGATAGNIPVGAPAINARLPLWANVNVTTGPKTWRRGALPSAPAGAGRILGLTSAAPVGAGAPSAPASTDWWKGNAAGAYALN